MAIHQYGLTRTFRRSTRGGYFKKQNGCAAWQAQNFQAQACHFLCLNPLSRLAQHRVEIAIGFPVAVKGRRLGRDFNVAGELFQNAGVPRLRDIAQGRLSVQEVCRKFFVNRCVHDVLQKIQFDFSQDKPRDVPPEVVSAGTYSQPIQPCQPHCADRRSIKSNT